MIFQTTSIDVTAEGASHRRVRVTAEHGDRLASRGVAALDVVLAYESVVSIRSWIVAEGEPVPDTSGLSIAHVSTDIDPENLARLALARALF